MEITRTTDIFVETKRRFLIRQPPNAERIGCPNCGELMLTAEIAAAYFGISCRTIYRMVETGIPHFAETGAGVMLLCLPSVAAILDGSQLPPAGQAGEI